MFDRPKFEKFVAEQMIAARHSWPPRPSDVNGALGYAERFLRFDDEIIDFIAHDRRAGRRGRPMHQDLQDLFERLARLDAIGNDLFELIDDEHAEEIWEKTVARAVEVTPYSAEQIAEMDGWEIFELINVVVAEGTTYVKGFFGRELNLDPANTSRLEGLELFLVSLVQAFFLDMRSVAWLVKQPLERGLNGLCRHYSVIVQVLYHIARRVTGRYEDQVVVTISGTHQFMLQFDHAWTWFIDKRRNTITPIDLTGADWLYDQEMAESIFNAGFDATAFTNTSSLVRTLIQPSLAHTSGLLGVDYVSELFPKLIDLESVHGQAVAFNLARQNILPAEFRERLLGHLVTISGGVLSEHADKLEQSGLTSYVTSTLDITGEANMYASFLQKLSVP